VIGQYYQLIRLGKHGYRSIMTNITRTADYLSAALETLGFKIMSQTSGKGLPLVAFRLDPSKKFPHDEFAIAHELRQRGWVVPAYTMAPHSEKLKLMRVVVREDFSRARCDSLIKDFKLIMEELKDVPKEVHEKARKVQQRKQSKVPHAKTIKSGDHEDDHSLQGKHDKSHPIC
jgi:glutamate decarboxylase